jgi:hypothetical protein
MLLGLAMAAALALPAAAQTAGASNETTVMLLTGKKMTVVPVDAKMMADIMKQAKPVEGSVIVFMSGGKTYMAPDWKMNDGKMMVDYLSSAYTVK